MNILPDIHNNAIHYITSFAFNPMHSDTGTEEKFNAHEDTNEEHMASDENMSPSPPPSQLRIPTAQELNTKKARLRSSKWAADAFVSCWKEQKANAAEERELTPKYEYMQQTVKIEDESIADDANSINVNRDGTLPVNMTDDHLRNGWFAVFDTETTGTSGQDVVIQMCIVMYDVNGHVQYIYNQYWKMPDDTFMSPMAEATHHISKEMLENKGLDGNMEIEHTIRIFNTLIQHNIPLVAHNASFDNRLLKQTAQKNGKPWPFDTKDFFCTQRASRKHVNAKDKLGRTKAPSNVELYMYFEHDLPQGDLHDAFVDCCVTATGYMRGSQARWW